MKRFLCPKHIHHLKVQGKSVQLSSPDCSICKWYNRPLRLADFAHQLEGISYGVRLAAEDIYYDPHGYFIHDLEKLLNRFLKVIHPEYRNNFIKGIMKDIK